MTEAPYLNCDGCRGTLGRAGCPSHRDSATYIDPSHSWSSSTPILTHCLHGLDLRLHPRCYLCNPAHEHGSSLGGELAAPAEGLDVEHPDCGDRCACYVRGVDDEAEATRD